MPRKKIPALFDPVLDPFLEEVFAALAKENKSLNEIDLSDPEMDRLLAEINKPDPEMDRLLAEMKDPEMDRILAEIAQENNFLNEIDLKLSKDSEIDFSLPADQFDSSCSTDEAIDIIAANNSLAEREMF